MGACVSQRWSRTAGCWRARAGRRWWRSSAGSTRACCTPRACPRCPRRCSWGWRRSTRRSATRPPRRCRPAPPAPRRSTRWRRACRTRTSRTRASCAASRARRSTSTTSPWCCPTDRSTARRYVPPRWAARHHVPTTTPRHYHFVM